MQLLTIDGLNHHYGEQIIFDQVGLVLNAGERLCVLGRNGAGKSTLLKVIQGKVEADAGTIWRMPSIRIASLDQDLPSAVPETVYDFVEKGLGDLHEDLLRFEALSARHDARSMEELGKVQQRIEAQDGWTARNRIQQVLTRLELPPTTMLSDLSGGWRRRVSLARALVLNPDLLLLDEPTNHLDVVAIEWLERQLLEFPGAIVFISHDRRFSRKVANRLGELDRGKLTLWDGDYEGFLALREQQLADEERHNAEFDRRLAEEEVWIRKGIKARRTRNEGRVRDLKEMRAERAQRVERQGDVSMTVNTEMTSGKLVAACEHVSFSWDSKPIVQDFSGKILRGDKIGLIGPNGVGKSTFLKLILGQLQPQSGAVTLGTRLSVAYFDQLREHLDLEKSAVDNIAEGREFIEIAGKSRHVISYLNDFLFTGERARTPIRALSGGERNRILLAKLFSKPANLLIMDEPTNDLDVETLELLEELLIAYDGTLLLVSHDREFLDNVVTSTIAFEGQGRVKEYVGGYEDWVRQGGVWPESGKSEGAVESNQASKIVSPPPAAVGSRKLSYKLQRELDNLPALIDRLEQEIHALTLEMSGPEFYQQPADRINMHTVMLEQKQAQLEQAYFRWEELESD